MLIKTKNSSIYLIFCFEFVMALCSISMSSISSRTLFLHCNNSVSQLANFERNKAISDFKVFSCCLTNSFSSSTYCKVCNYKSS